MDSDLTNENGYYDTNQSPELENNLSEPDDRTLEIYVENWNSGKVLQRESGGVSEINISCVPIKTRYVYLVDGRNFIGLPLKPENLNIENVLGDLAAVDTDTGEVLRRIDPNVVRWDESDQSWNVYDPDLSVNSLGEMHSGKGHLITIDLSGIENANKVGFSIDCFSEEETYNR